MDLKRIVRYKPGASVGAHLFTAALMWSVIGTYLLIRGLIMYGAGGVGLLFGALVVGTVKSRYILDKAAWKNIKRIVRFQDGTCLGSVYTWKMWGLIVLMMLAGRLLRGSAVPAHFVGLLYVAVGWGLFLSSRLLWQQWRP